MKSFSRMVLLAVVVALIAGVGCGGKRETTAFEKAEQGSGRAVSTTRDPAALDQLPATYRLSDEEIANILRDYKFSGPDIPVDPSRSERIDCKRCAMILYGIILYPPFYITTVGQTMYVNGYQLVPRKTFQQIDYLKPSTEEQKKYLQEMEKRDAIDDPHESAALEIASQALNERRDERWVREQCAQRNVTVKSVMIDQDHVEIEYFRPAAGVYATTWAMNGGGPAPTPSGQDPSDPHNNLSYRSLKKRLTDGNLYVANGNVKNIEVLDTILVILRSDVDDRVKLYQLQKTLSDRESARGLLANPR